MDSFEVSLKKSSEAFEKFFKKPLLEILRGGSIRIVEGVTTDEISNILDQLAGIDLWFFDENRGVRGIASRIQFTDTPYRTFTIRRSRASGVKTEYEKRKQAMENEWLYPVLTFQGYVSLDGDTPLCFAVARTVDILWMIEHGLCQVQHTKKDQIGQASFFVVNWDDMIAQNKRIVTKEFTTCEVCEVDDHRTLPFSHLSAVSGR